MSSVNFCRRIITGWFIKKIKRCTFVGLQGLRHYKVKHKLQKESGSQAQTVG